MGADMRLGRTLAIATAAAGLWAAVAWAQSTGGGDLPGSYEASPASAPAEPDAPAAAPQPEPMPADEGAAPPSSGADQADHDATPMPFDVPDSNQVSEPQTNEAEPTPPTGH
jgi:hypothetical protein